MIIAHNLQAMNSQRQYNIVTGKKSKLAEKLSSGYRINRAADDAAGLAISEKMRRQIRGLNQGSENIQDGISLIQTAEGAMGELCDILQRMNELTVKSYNDTNQQEDREYMQAEIENLLGEFDRIVDSTTFNEKYLLKGNPEVTKTITSTDEGTTLVHESRLAPDWLTSYSDSRLEVHSSYTGTQDTTGIMLTLTNLVDMTGVYYGDDQGTIVRNGGTYTYAGTWTSGISDNPSAKISFEGLTTVTSIDDLTGSLMSLLGTAVGVPCGTCRDQYYAIGFAGEYDGYTNSMSQFSDEIPIGAFVDLNEAQFDSEDGSTKLDYFEKIEELSAIFDSDATLTDAAKATRVQALADTFAQTLASSAFTAMSNATDYEGHFDRALQSDVYSIIVYDFRDSDKLTSASAANASLNFTSDVTSVIPNKYLVDGDTITAIEPLYIQCSSIPEDKIPINLPYLNLGALDLSDYNVASYYESKADYSAEYAAKLAAWENDPANYITSTIPARDVTIDVYDWRKVYENGELVRKRVKTGTRTVTIPELTSKKLDESTKPVPEEGDVTIVYKREDIGRVKNALDIVLRERADLGATQNRLEHTYKNNQNKEENTQAAESRIRDTDMSKAMVEYSKQNILEQVSEAIMAQANSSKQGVLQLLG